MNPIKCVLVGDSGVGKTCILISYLTNKFPEDYVPELFDGYTFTAIIDDEPYTVGLFDTQGKNESDHNRLMSYPSTDVFLLCFSVADPVSFENVEKKWVQEVMNFDPEAYYILLGNKVELRDDQNVKNELDKKGLEPVSKEKGEQLAERIGAVRYIECSAKTQYNLKEVYQIVVDSFSQPPPSDGRKRRRLNCALL